MTDQNDLRERVARAIANVREGGWPADTYALLQQHYLTMADAAIAEMGTVSVREAARVLLDAARIEPVHDAIQRSVRPAAFCSALRAIAEGKDDE